MGFITFLLRTRGLRVASAAAAGAALVKVVSWAAAEVGGGAGTEADAYLARTRALSHQLFSWGAKAHAVQPTFNEQLESGQFVHLQDVLGKTLPHIMAAVDQFDDTPQGALRVRDACVLGERPPRKPHPAASEDC